MLQWHLQSTSAPAGTQAPTTIKEHEMKEKNPEGQKFVDYEEPQLLDAEDLHDVAGGCTAGCVNGTCSPPPPPPGPKPQQP